ncbi:hypothetical protein B0T24DRAFT_683583 [Lasiosphaeria ovina]|uniref:Uncharacterized protein n=1 Tax=Lasiosphaeria ovina TaxID=92902 RepID=A0AAE0MZ52_9PEZI|nr:hypothetical protein B0T24DRAFT_683583 [Lasiosphaeria ovina]
MSAENDYTTGLEQVAEAAIDLAAVAAIAPAPRPLFVDRHGQGYCVENYLPPGWPSLGASRWARPGDLYYTPRTPGPVDVDVDVVHLVEPEQVEDDPEAHEIFIDTPEDITNIVTDIVEDVADIIEEEVFNANGSIDEEEIANIMDEVIDGIAEIARLLRETSL